MEDSQIIEMYWQRNQGAIPATSEKYGKYCASIAANILENREDAEECVNDTWLGAWNSMPPHRPSVLSAFLGKITRNLAFNRYKRNRAQKRGSGELPLVLDELGECVSGRAAVEMDFDRKELLDAINRFLSGLTPEKRSMFVCRYWYADSVGEIALRFGITENYASMTLSRLRRSLQEDLKRRGFTL